MAIDLRSWLPDIDQLRVRTELIKSPRTDMPLTVISIEWIKYMVTSHCLLLMHDTSHLILET